MGNLASILSDSDDISTNNCTAIPEFVPLELDSCVKSIIVPLSPDDILALKTTWSVIASNWTEICRIAFERWFTAHPEIRKLFKLIPDDLPNSDLIYCHSLQVHARMIAKTVDQALLVIDHKKEFVKNILDLGRLHYNLGAEHKYTKALAASLQYAVCETVKIEMREESAWDSLFRFVLGLLKLGMRMEMNRKEKNSKEKDIL